MFLWFYSQNIRVCKNTLVVKTQLCKKERTKTTLVCFCVCKSFPVCLLTNCKCSACAYHGSAKTTAPLPGIEPGSPAWQAGILTTILQRPRMTEILTRFIRSVNSEQIGGSPGLELKRQSLLLQLQVCILPSLQRAALLPFAHRTPNLLSRLQGFAPEIQARSAPFYLSLFNQRWLLSYSQFLLQKFKSCMSMQSWGTVDSLFFSFDCKFL